MESGTRKKRTLAERRESDKLRQRRFRAKKREEARLLQVISGVASGDGSLDDKKERNYATPRKTAEEIRETNRIRQQRFRAKKRTSDDSTEDCQVEMETEEGLEQTLMSGLSANPAQALSKIIVDALNEAKQRQTEVRREKDRLRKRKERQRKKQNELRKMGIDLEDIQKLTNNLEEDEEMEEAEEQDSAESPETLIKQEVEDAEFEGATSSATNGFFDSIQFMSQLEQMDLLMKLANSVEGGIQIPDLNITPNSPETSMEELGASSSPILPTAYEEIMLSEKKPWQRCSSSEERRERERMRKRMYRAKQKFISTGKLEMQWDPTPIKRTPNDEGEVGITPIPEWTKNLSSEQKQAAHRIYNKRYRERMRNNAGDRESSKETEEAAQQADIDFSNLPPEIYKEILATISQCDLSSLVAQSNA